MGMKRSYTSKEEFFFLSAVPYLKTKSSCTEESNTPATFGSTTNTSRNVIPNNIHVTLHANAAALNATGILDASFVFSTTLYIGIVSNPLYTGILSNNPLYTGILSNNTLYTGTVR
jgi:hypothetical protein